MINTSTVNKYLLKYLPKLILSRNIVIWQTCYSTTCKVLFVPNNNFTFLLQLIKRVLYTTRLPVFEVLSSTSMRKVSQNEILSFSVFCELHCMVRWVKINENFRKRVCLQYKIWAQIFCYSAHQIEQYKIFKVHTTINIFVTLWRNTFHHWQISEQLL